MILGMVMFRLDEKPDFRPEPVPAETLPVIRGGIQLIQPVQGSHFHIFKCEKTDPGDFRPKFLLPVGRSEPHPACIPLH